MNEHAPIEIHSEMGHFAIVPEWILDIASTTALRLWCRLGRYADRKGLAWPSIHALAEKTGMSESTVKRGIAELVEIGALEVVRRTAPRKGFVGNGYLLRYSEPESREVKSDPTGGREVTDDPHRQVTGDPPDIVDEREPVLTITNNPLTPLPDFIDYPLPVLVAFKEYEAYRKEQKLKKLGPRGQKMCLKMLGDEPDPKACVEYTMRNGYTGLFSHLERNRGKKQQPEKTSAEHRNEILEQFGI